MNTQKVRDEHGRIIEDEIKFFTIGGNEVAFGFFKNDAKGKRDLDWMMGQWELILERESQEPCDYSEKFCKEVCGDWGEFTTDVLDSEDFERFKKLAKKHQVHGVMTDNKDTVHEFLEFTFKRYYDIAHAKLVAEAKRAAEAVKAHERHFNHIQGSMIKTRG